MRDAMEPTMHLRWFRRRRLVFDYGQQRIVPHPADDSLERVLQQLWSTPDCVNRVEEWRDVPVGEE